MRKLLIFISVLSAFGLVSCGKSEDKNDKKIVEKISYNVSEVVLLQPQKDIVLPADLKPFFVVKIFPKLKGFVKKILVDRGSHVRQGQLLASIEAPELEAQLTEANAKLEQSMSNLYASSALYRRVLQTSKTLGAISLQELDVAHSKMLADSANFLASKANLLVVKEMKNYLLITAPFDGTITERNVAVGELVGPDEAAKIKPLFVIEDHHKLRLTVAIPEVYSSSLRQNQEVSFKVTAIPEKKFMAKLSRTSESLEENIRSMMAEFDYLNTNQEVKAGMYADVSLPIQRKVPTMFVPTKAVVNSTEKLFVIKVENNLAKWIDVRKGIALDSLTEVFGDIHAGDKVISSASDEIKNGQKIIVK